MRIPLPLLPSIFTPRKVFGPCATGVAEKQGVRPRRINHRDMLDISRVEI